MKTNNEMLHYEAKRFIELLDHAKSHNLRLDVLTLLFANIGLEEAQKLNKELIHCLDEFDI